jgi:hypothetical protein
LEDGGGLVSAWGFGGGGSTCTAAHDRVGVPWVWHERWPQVTDMMRARRATKGGEGEADRWARLYLKFNLNSMFDPTLIWSKR